MRVVTTALLAALALGAAATARADAVRPARYQLRVLASGACLDLGNGNATVRQSSCDPTNSRLSYDVVDLGTGYYRVANVATGLVLDVYGGSTADAADVITWSWHGGENQQFLFQRNGNGYVMRNRKSGKCVDLRGWDTSAGAALQQIACSGASNQTVELVPLDNGQAPFADGRYSFRAVHSGHCIDVPSSSTASGTDLQQYTCNGTGAQQFDVTYVGNNVYEMRNITSGICVDLQSGSTSNGQPIQQYTCNQSAAQRWFIRGNADGSVEIASALHSGKVWDVKGVSTSTGAGIQIYDRHGGGNQRFWMDPVQYGPNVADGIYRFTGVDSGKCIDVPGSSTSVGTQLQQYSCNGTNAQNFRVTHVSDGYYSVINVNSGLALSVADFSAANKAGIVQHESHGGANELFRFVPRSGAFEIRPMSSYRCLDVEGGSNYNNAKIQQYSCNGGSNQVFRLSGGTGSGAAGAARNSYPVVLVHGLMGWGRDEFLGYKYWGGGFQNGGDGDLQEVLRQNGVMTFTAAVGPVSSARDRAIELFYQLKGGCVDYGPVHSSSIAWQDGAISPYSIIRRLDGGTNPDGTVRPRKCWARDPNNNPHNDPIALYPEWGDDPSKKIHLVGHSFGGPTIRMLLQLLRAGDPRELASDPSLLDESQGANPYTGGKNWVASLTSVTALQNGTSFDSLMDWSFPAIHAVAGSVGAMMGMLGEDNALYNLKMEQWGLMRNPGESMSSYWNRVEQSGVWYTLRNTADWDMSPQGMQDINDYVGHWNDVYYFSFSGRTTWRSWFTGHELPLLVTNPLLSVTAIATGRYTQGGPGLVTVDSSWWPNDGLVNVISQRAPAGDPSVAFATGNTPQIGTWNLYSTMEGWDHLDFCNVMFADKSRATVNNLYLTHASVLRSLGN